MNNKGRTMDDQTKLREALRCFACDKKIGARSAADLVDTRDDQLVYVGAECRKKIEAAGEAGYQPPKGGPRLFLIDTGEGMRHKLRDLIEGMSVSVDVSTCEEDSGHRYFGTVTEVMDDPHDKHGVTLLVQNAEPNFEPAALATEQRAGQVEARQLPEGWREELLGWVSACQSAYRIASAPGHRFGGLCSALDENRASVIEYVEGLLAATQAADPAPAQVEAQQALTETPSSQWRASGEADPHAGRYDCERAALAMGDLTDDELANGAFMNYNAPLDVHGIVLGTASSPIAWMTAVKDRIRWLSRSLEKAVAQASALPKGTPGFVLVPVEPTEAMKIAGDNAGFWCADKYRAMLAARPPQAVEPEAQQAGEPVAGGRPSERAVFAVAFALAEADGVDDPHHLIYEGGPIPEPWGEVWQRYEPQATHLLELAIEADRERQAEGWLSDAYGNKVPASRGLMHRLAAPASTLPAESEAEDARDARRWRYLRDKARDAGPIDSDGYMVWAVCGTSHLDANPCSLEELDAAVDAALAQSAPPAREEGAS